MKTRPSTLISPQDVNFLLYDWLRVGERTQSTRYSHLSIHDFDALLDLSLDFAERELAPLNRAADVQEPMFDGTSVTVLPELARALQRYYASGLMAAQMPLRVDGGQLPHSVTRACFAFLQAASLAATAYPMLSAANANLLLAHGTPEQVDRFVRPMLDGRFYGTMCLSETQAGSSLADVATRAVRHPDGSYRIFGSKMWISGGDHDMSQTIVHLVLARVPGAPAGVRGLSLFIVPKHLIGDDGSVGPRNDVSLVGINHKMGYRGTVNTVLAFGESGVGATGWLVGAEGEGLPIMFHMMNEARLVVGASAAAAGYSSYLHARDYARSRLQGRPVDSKNPDAQPVPIAEHSDVRRMLLAAKSYAEGALALTLYASDVLDHQLSATDEGEREEAGLVLDILTPVVKGWNSTWCSRACDLAIQVHGGYGYTRDYPVEQLWRDNRLNSIHEGTDGIQALDLLGRKVSMRDGAALVALTARMTATIERAHHQQRTATLAARVAARVAALQETTATLLDTQPASLRLANSTLYADAFGHTVIAWLWLEQVLALGDRDDSFARGKWAAADYFATYELPYVDVWLATAAAVPTLLTDLDPRDL